MMTGPWRMRLLVILLGVGLGIPLLPPTMVKDRPPGRAWAIPTAISSLFQRPVFAQTAELAEADQLQEQVNQLYEQGQYDVAIPLAQRVLEIRKRILEADDPRIAIALNNVAELYRVQGRYTEAEPFFEAAIAIIRKVLPPEDPNLSTPLNNLALLYQVQGRYDEAETLNQEVLAIDRKALPPNHPNLARDLNNLAELYRLQGRYTEAEPLYQEAIAILRDASPNSASLATVVNNLALLLQLQGRFQEAEALFQEALTLDRQILTPEHPDLARDLSNLAGLYQAQGRYSEAEPLYQEAIALFRKVLPPNHPNIATVLLSLGGLYQLQGNYRAAELPYREALAIDREALPPEHPDLARDLVSLGFLYEVQGRYTEAESLYHEGLAILRKALPTAHPAIATALNRLGLFFQARGRYRDAEPLLQEALTIDRQALPANHPDLARDFNNLAFLYQAQGRFSEAETNFQAAIALLRQTLPAKHPSIATSLNNLGLLYRAQGRYQEAESTFNEAIEIDRIALPEDHHDRGRDLNNLALLYQDQGRYTEAESVYQQALTILRKALPPEHPTIATNLNNLGLLYQSQGRYEEAETIYHQALAIDRKALPPNHPDLARDLNNLALLYHVQGRFAEAEPIYQEALAIFRKALPPNHPHLATDINNLGLLYQAQGRYEEAETLYQEAIAIDRQALPANHPDLGRDLNNLALLYQTQKRYQEAEPIYQEALAIVRQSLPPDHPSLATHLNNLSSLYWAQKNVPRAIQFLEQGLAIEETNLTRNLAVGAERQKQAYLALFSSSTHAAISAHLQLAPTNLQAARLALTTILRRKGRILDVLGQSVQRLRHTLDPSLQTQLEQLATLRTQRSNLTARGLGNQSLAAYREELNALTRQAEQLEADLSNASADLRREFNPVEIATIQAVIPEDAVLVEFILYRPVNPASPGQGYYGPPRYAAYLLKAQGDPQWADLGLAEDLDASITAFRQAVEDPSLPTAGVKSKARALEAQLMQPVRSQVGDTRHLLIAPDGAINLIPFEALVDQENRYLLETYRFTYLTSGRDLLRLQDPSPKPQAPLLLASPTYDQPGQVSPRLIAQNRGTGERSSDLAQFRVDPLEETLSEGQSIAALLPQAHFYTGTEATEAIVKQSPNPSILHIATHGFFLKDVPRPVVDTRQGTAISQEPTLPQIENPLLRSGLALAGFNLRRDPEDGVLTALEVSGLDLRGTQMVVLSACQTGEGEVVNGEGVYGLRRAFTLAGARSQLMSLWTVSDAGTKDLMVAYYQRLKQGQARGEALRQVQMAMLEGSLTSDQRQRYDHPYYWAAFVRVGDWRSMKGF